jgi:tetratricopeptide (TPR) repeat protein
MPQTTPILFLAFANDENHSLRQLAREHDALKAVLEPLRREGKCEVITLADATPDKVIEKFQQHPGRIRLFHYGGHSNEDALFLAKDFPGQNGIKAGNLAGFLALQEGLEALRESMIEKMRQGDYGNPVTDNFPWVTYAQALAAYLDTQAHERISVLQNNLALVLKALGDYAGARRLFGKAFTVFSHYLGEDHPNTKTVGRWLKHMDELEDKN